MDGGVGGVLELLQQNVLRVRRTYFGSDAAIASAWAMAPFMPLAPSVSTSLAP